MLNRNGAQSSYVQQCMRGAHCGHRVALLCAALHCTGLLCSTLHCTALHCTGLHCTGLHCTGLHCTGLHCTAQVSPAESAAATSCSLSRRRPSRHTLWPSESRRTAKARPMPLDAPVTTQTLLSDMTRFYLDVQCARTK
jgi:hypothetical protein